MDTATAIRIVKDVHLTRLCQLCATCVVLYDHMITIHQENRYVGDAIVCIEAAELFVFVLCRGLGWGSAIVCWGCQAIMQLRVLVIYGNSPRFKYFILLCFFIEIVAMSTLLELSYLHGQNPTDQPVPGIRMCTTAPVPHYTFAFCEASTSEAPEPLPSHGIFSGLPICAFEAMLLGFVLWKGISESLTSKEQRQENPIRFVLFRDTILYFFSILIACVVNAIIWAALPLTPSTKSVWQEVTEGFAAAAYCVLASRLMLNLRDAYYCPEPYTIDPLSTIEFVASSAQIQPPHNVSAGHDGAPDAGLGQEDIEMASIGQEEMDGSHNVILRPSFEARRPSV
ncbi:hypothetical protein JAAARDRAFT_47062 [Jaapia argillacea MUCL 33604]|uniref:DUF6533 domain-containing protein n=1 Tax=Jaapia argillacea MUCL 33604 TaxID=933084 RepID=A0A067PVE7_9AGAM|nr:hypothetical protein JAAARDRAFT_47062 [Jaapia argillacea MUCL 33604]